MAKILYINAIVESMFNHLKLIAMATNLRVPKDQEFKIQCQKRIRP